MMPDTRNVKSSGLYKNVACWCLCCSYLMSYKDGFVLISIQRIESKNQVCNLSAMHYSVVRKQEAQGACIAHLSFNIYTYLYVKQC